MDLAFTSNLIYKINIYFHIFKYYLLINYVNPNASTYANLKSSWNLHIFHLV